jgi:hypothetical protein
LRSEREGVRALAHALRAQGGSLGAAVGAPDGAAADGADGDESELERPGPAQLAAAGPRAAGHESEYELLFEMILEGTRVHYGKSRVLAIKDGDLGLLLGDQLYALGLARLATLGDVTAVAELADTISLVSQAAALGDRDLEEAIWEAGAVAVGWGAGAAYRAAKRAARAEDPAAADRLRAAARAACAAIARLGSADGRGPVGDTLASPRDPAT